MEVDVEPLAQRVRGGHKIALHYRKTKPQHYGNTYNLCGCGISEFG